MATRTRILGTTRILEPLGKGGMAEVYRGIQKPLQRPVAVKVMLPKLARQKDWATRFRREALAIGAMQHENIVAVYDLIEKNRQLFLIMELVEGTDLGALLALGTLPVDVTLIIGAAIARALEHAHFRRVIHRDIKPANIMISKHGVVKLTDFGIAKDTSIDDLTQTGLVVGTPSYVAPERIAGKTGDPRSDLYSLGIVMFQCIAGERPFRAKSTAELFVAIQKGDRQRLRALAPQCPRGVERIIDRCLEVDPEKRWKRASELRQAIDVHLRRALDGSPSARMVSFLYERGLTDTEHLATLDIAAIAELDATIGAKVTEAAKKRERAESIEVSVEMESEARRSRGGVISLGVLLVAVASGFATWLFAPEAVEAAWEWLRALAR